jgi:hypothetical protein
LKRWGSNGRQLGHWGVSLKGIEVLWPIPLAFLVLYKVSRFCSAIGSCDDLLPHHRSKSNEANYVLKPPNLRQTKPSL